MNDLDREWLVDELRGRCVDAEQQRDDARRAFEAADGAARHVLGLAEQQHKKHAAEIEELRRLVHDLAARHRA